MPLEEQIERVAIDEVVSPSFVATKQYLHSNKLLFENGQPVVEDVTIEKGGAGARVYFRVWDEDYYFVVDIDIGDDLSVRWVGTSAGNTVKLTVGSGEMPLSVLLDGLDIAPSDQWEKGEKKSSGRGLREDSGFRHVLSTKKTGDVEDKVKALVEFLMPRRERMAELARDATTEISIAYHGYKEDMWGFHFDAETLLAVGRLGLSIDIDLYASGPDLE